MSVDRAITPSSFCYSHTHAQGEARRHGKYCNGSQFDASAL